MIYGNRVKDMLLSVDHSDVTRYLDYWTSIKPKNHDEYFQRWLFSFLSVHTRWEVNIAAYKLLKDMSWTVSKEELMELLRLSKSGLYHVRSKGIWDFHQKFYADPTKFYRQSGEGWKQCRNRLAGECFGLGLAKTAFVLEMAYPEECQTVCLDTHILKLYGKYSKESTGPVNKSTYMRMENHWVDSCIKAGFPSAIIRNMCWDKAQNQEKIDYWSYVFH